MPSSQQPLHSDIPNKQPDDTRVHSAIFSAFDYVWTPSASNTFPAFSALDSDTVKHHWGGVSVTPCTINSPAASPAPTNSWVRFVHLDGSAYFFEYHSRIVTPEDMSDPETYSKFYAAFAKLDVKISSLGRYGYGWPTLVVEGIDRPDGPTAYIMDYQCCRYYDLFPTDGNRQVRVEERTERFWAALEAYPMHIILPPPIDADFLGALSFGASERILEWNETSFPFTDDQTRRLIQVYRELKTSVDLRAAVVPAYCWHIARTMVKIERARQISKFGTPQFQLYRDVVSDDVGWGVKLADVCLGVILFGAHRMYRIRLQGVRIKGVVYLPDFRELLKNFLAEWSDSNLLATVFVGANIAFLAVPNINSLQRTASLASTVFSVLSVATGVHHTWHHRTKVDASYEEASKYLSHPGLPSNSTTSSDADLALTACLLSLPLVALLYGVLCFALALGAFCVQATDAHARVLLAVVLGVAGTAGGGTLLFFWYAWRGPRDVAVGEEDVREVMRWGWRSRVRGVLARARGTVRREMAKARGRLAKGEGRVAKETAGEEGEAPPGESSSASPIALAAASPPSVDPNSPPRELSFTMPHTVLSWPSGQEQWGRASRSAV